jgi:hypothetical protein
MTISSPRFGFESIRGRSRGPCKARLVRRRRVRYRTQETSVPRRQSCPIDLLAGGSIEFVIGVTLGFDEGDLGIDYFKPWRVSCICRGSRRFGLLAILSEVSFERCLEVGYRSLGVDPPIGRPHTVDAPPEAAKDVLAQ